MVKLACVVMSRSIVILRLHYIHTKLNGRLYLAQDSVLNGKINVFGVVALSDNLNVSGSLSTINGNMNAKYLSITNISTFADDVTVSSGSINIVNGNINMTNEASFINQFSN